MILNLKWFWINQFCGSVVQTTFTIWRPYMCLKATYPLDFLSNIKAYGCGGFGNFGLFRIRDRCLYFCLCLFVRLHPCLCLRLCLYVDLRKSPPVRLLVLIFTFWTLEVIKKKSPRGERSYDQCVVAQCSYFGCLFLDFYESVYL